MQLLLASLRLVKMAINTFVKGIWNPERFYIMAFSGLGVALAYIVLNLVLKEGNPLEWLNAPSRNNLHEQLNNEAMILADRNGNGYLEPSELEELFRRAGREPPRFTLKPYGKYSASEQVYKGVYPSLPTSTLEEAIQSYRAEQTY
ncbi:hypothetical protein HYV82_00910 [Candidatus Woesearchaeota archaeon]|nr:hypothetical protein [Candidatus Woesearchaeota archaeon]